MADALTKKVFISVDSEEVQQECVKASRRKLGVIQKDATDKENLIGRQRALLNQKLQLESTPIDKKKKAATLVSQHSQTIESGPSHSVSEHDLTSTEAPSEKYWQHLAESRRRALEDSLAENEGLHGRVRSLEEELNVTNEMLDEAKSLVEILKEMLEENEAKEPTEEKEDDEEEEETEANDQTPPSSAEKKEPVTSDAQDDD